MAKFKYHDLETWAPEVGDGVEYLRRLIVVRKDDRVALALEPQDRIDVRKVRGPLDARDDSADALIKRGVAIRQLPGIDRQRRLGFGSDGVHRVALCSH